MMKLLSLGVFLLIGGVLTEDLCIGESKDGKCAFPARKISDSEVDSLIILCKLAKGVFPFQPRDSMALPKSRNRKQIPYLEMRNYNFEYMYNFHFGDCEENIKARRETFFWQPNVGSDFVGHTLLAREFNVDDKERNNTCIGLAQTTDSEKVVFNPIHRDNFDGEEPKEPYSYEYLTLLVPLKQTFNVTKEVSRVETLNYSENVGFFTYYNPSEFEQVIEMFVDIKYRVAYNFKDATLDDSLFEVNDAEDNQDVNILTRQNIENSLQKRTGYNVTVPPFTAITARIVGKQTTVKSDLLATRFYLYSDEPSGFNSTADVTGNRNEYFLKDFYLEDVQVHHTSEVLVLNYTTIYVALLCLGVVLLAGIVVFSVRLAIKKFRTPPAVPYQTLQADS
ncbi:uncharacterized protein LOC132255758 [Phlebotomus argentipes]|uniref:uncharacterized protein LOC132255758 n=1 Tax=Phlebotomus argentipes TaxID=94469 RepID=UPI0028929965|nr:uncharacterized protein LOC132255758 [Phlebotomus argentipes]